VTLDAPAQKIEALVDVGDHGLLRRQAQDRWLKAVADSPLQLPWRETPT
jgi:hypothetical protein